MSDNEDGNGNGDSDGFAPSSPPPMSPSQEEFQNDADMNESNDGNDHGNGNEDEIANKNENENMEQEWEEYQDEEGRTYYYNATSGETQWEAPTGNVIIKKPDYTEGDDAEGGAENVNNDPDLNGNGNGAGAGQEGNNDGDGDDDGNGAQMENNIKKEDDMESKNTTNNAGAGAADVDANMAEPLDTTQSSPWTKYQDDEGRDYYYNSVTEETQWDRPEDFVDDATSSPPDEYEEGYVNDDDADNRDQGGDYNDDAGPESTSGGGGDMDMSAVDQGQIVKVDDATADADANTNASSSNIAIKDEALSTSEDATSKAVKLEPELELKSESPPRDPKEVAIENSLAFLNKPDSVLEPGASSHLETLIREKQMEGAGMALRSLSSSYVGQTAICGILSRWLVNLKQVNNGNRNKGTHNSTASASASVPTKKSSICIEAFDKKELHLANAETVRNLVEQVVARTAKSHFTDESQQRLFALNRKERQFFEEMMEHERWRRLLIDLSAQHKDSALLTLLLQKISKRGYHREIAKRMDQSDFFEVFHGMLVSELLALGKFSVNGGKASADETNQINNAETIVSDLKRQCSSTEYTYVYVMELLNELVARARTKLKTLTGPKALGLARATRKWERLRENIEGHMIKPDDNASQNPLSKKRRADIALTSSELYQQQRRKIRILNKTGNSNGSERLQYSVESGILNILKKYSRNTSMDDKLADQLLYNPFTDKSMSTEQNEVKLGTLLCGQALSVEYLLRTLFLPSMRSKSNEMRMKCSKIAAMAVFAIQKKVADDSVSDNETFDIDTVETLSRMILKGSQLCEQVETSVKLVVSEDITGTNGNASVGSQMSNLCIKCSTVAQGFLVWALERSSKTEFPSTAHYPYTAPGILSLVRIIISHHPLQRVSTIELAMNFIGHSCSELSYQRLNAIKEQAVRLLLIIATKGLAIDVFNAVTSKVKSGRSTFDSRLIRYFMSGLLDIMRPPFSLGIVQSMGSLLLLSPCTEALNAVYFDSNKKQKLRTFIGYFSDVVSDEHKAFARFTSRDQSICAALKSAYKLAS